MYGYLLSILEQQCGLIRINVIASAPITSLETSKYFISGQTPTNNPDLVGKVASVVKWGYLYKADMRVYRRVEVEVYTPRPLNTNTNSA